MTANVGWWIATLVAGGSVSCLYFIIRKQLNDHKSEQKEKIDKMEEDIEKCVTSEVHNLMCENNALKVAQKVSEEMTKFKDEVFEFLRNFEKKFNHNSSHKEKE
jgi:hypothetical protein